MKKYIGINGYTCKWCGFQNPETTKTCTHCNRRLGDLNTYDIKEDTVNESS